MKRTVVHEPDYQFWSKSRDPNRRSSYFWRLILIVMFPWGIHQQLREMNGWLKALALRGSGASHRPDPRPDPAVEQAARVAAAREIMEQEQSVRIALNNQRRWADKNENNSGQD